MSEYFIEFDAGGRLIGRYLSKVHGDAIPDKALPVDADTFNRTIAENDKLWRLAADGSIVSEIILPTLDESKAAQVQAINAGFTEALAKGFGTSLGYRMDARLEDLQKLKTGYDFAKLAGDSSMPVVDYDNALHNYVPLADVEIILKEVGDNYRNIYLTKQQLRGQIQAAGTEKDVRAITWPV